MPVRKSTFSQDVEKTTKSTQSSGLKETEYPTTPYDYAPSTTVPMTMCSNCLGVQSLRLLNESGLCWKIVPASSKLGEMLGIRVCKCGLGTFDKDKDAFAIGPGTPQATATVQQPRANEVQVGGTHYQAAIQHWDYVLANDIPYLEAMVIKYLTRWRKKGGAEDVRKAYHFLLKLAEASEINLFLPSNKSEDAPGRGYVDQD